MVMNWSMLFIKLLLSNYHRWVDFLNLTWTNTVFSFHVLLCLDIKLFQNERWGILKSFWSFCFILLEAFCILGHAFIFFGVFLFLLCLPSFSVSCKTMSICIVYLRHKCDGGSGHPWSCGIMVKRISWSYFFLRW